MARTAEFGGFPAEGLQFMQELAANNNKAWFDAHKDIYLHAVQEPAQALVVALGTRLQAEFPPVQYDTRTNGSGSLLRIYRDTRFSADKSPYKANIAMMFVPGGGKRMELPGFGLQITLEQVDLMAGLFAFSGPQLARFRQAVLDDKRGEGLLQAVEKVRAAGDYTIGGKELRRVPREYDVGHPRAEWLMYKGLHAYSPPIALAVARTPALVEAVMGHFRQMAPIQQWLAHTASI